MTIKLVNGKTYDAICVEESYSPRMEDRGVTLNLHFNSEESVEELRDVFTAETTATIKVVDGDAETTIQGYTEVDSIRRIYDGNFDFNTAVDMVKPRT